MRVMNSPFKGVWRSMWGDYDGGPLIYITDIYPGFEVSPHVTTITSGRIAAADKFGVLQLTAENEPCTPGGVFATTVAEGAELGDEILISVAPGLDPGWVNNGDGSFTFTGPVTGNANLYALVPSGTTFAGKYYLITYSGESDGLKISAGGYLSAEGATYFEQLFIQPGIGINAGAIKSFTTTRTISNIRVREVIPKWLPSPDWTSDLITVKPLDGPSSVVTRYTDPDYDGPMVWPGMTNKVTCRKCNPVDTSGLIKSGDAAAVLSVVDDSAALASAGLSGFCTSGKAYEIDNTAGVTGISIVTFSGAVGNTNAHSASIYSRVLSGTQVIGRIGGTHDTIISNTSDYTRGVLLNKIPTTAGELFNLYLATGAKARFILPQLVESPFIGPVLADPLNDDLQTYTKTATVISRPTAGTALAGGQNFGLILSVTPYAAGQTGTLWSTYTDVDNYTKVSTTSTEIILTKRKSGTSYTATATYTHVKDTAIYVIAYQSEAGMGVAVKPVGGSVGTYGTLTNADGKAAASIASAYQLGAVNSATQFAGGHEVEVITVPSGLTEANVKTHIESLVPA